ncbi:MAG TPA: GWxTD domain-containing protein [bacterium]|nr:GWxTD domain-containing protein [bacterium]
MNFRLKIIFFMLKLLFLSAICFGSEFYPKNDFEDSATVSLADSMTLLKTQIENYPNDHLLKLQLADILLRSEQLEQAEQVYQQLTAVDSLAVWAFIGLGRVEFEQTLSRVIPFERLKELLKIDHRSKAIHHFKKALEVRADNLVARYYLAQAYMRKTDPSNLKNAEQQIAFIQKIAPNYRDIVYLQGRIYQGLKQHDKALKYFQSIPENAADYARARIRMSEVYFETGNHQLATSCYYQGMETLTDHEMIDYLYDEQKVLLAAQERNEFESSPYTEKRHLFLKFWNRRDPDPSNVKNERLMEHFRRVNFARQHFHFTAPPYYDDRGRIYIKFGAPDARYQSPIGNLPVKENESWTYESIADGLVFDFVADGGYFREVEDLTQAALAGYGFENKLILSAQLYQDRSHLSKTYSRLSAGFSRDQLNNFRATRIEALSKAPIEIFIPEDEDKLRFPFIVKWAQFKAPDNHTRVEFYTSFPGFALSINPLNPAAPRNIDFFVQIDDTNFNSILTDKKRYAYHILQPEKLANQQYIFQNDYLISPAVYSAAFVLSDIETENKGSQRHDLVIKDFSGDSLMLSSLQLAANIKSKQPGSNLAFEKNELIITPYTFNRVSKKRPIYLYFETYNLALDQDNHTRFELSYSAETIRPEENFWQKTVGRLFGANRKTVISTTMNRVGDSKNTFEHIAFDLTALPIGEAELTVAIKDLITGSRVQSTIEMLLID